MAFEGTLQEFTIRMHGHTLEHPYIEAQQGDTASRKVRIHLKTFGGADFLIPYGATAVLSVDKTDGHKVLNECEIEDSSTIIITLTSQTLACPGKQPSQIYIFTDKGDIKTQKFYIHVPKAVYDQDAIKSTDEYGILLELIERIENLGGGGSGATEEQLEQIEQNKNDITQLKSDLTKEVTDRQNAVEAETAKRKAEIAVERARIDAFTSLSEGDTTGNAELVDARVDCEGKTWTNVGNHVRGITGKIIDACCDKVIISSENYNLLTTGGMNYNSKISTDYGSLLSGTNLNVVTDYLPVQYGKYYVLSWDENGVRITCKNSSAPDVRVYKDINVRKKDGSIIANQGTVIKTGEAKYSAFYINSEDIESVQIHIVNGQDLSSADKIKACKFMLTSGDTLEEAVTVGLNSAYMDGDEGSTSETVYRPKSDENKADKNDVEKLKTDVSKLSSRKINVDPKYNDNFIQNDRFIRSIANLRDSTKAKDFEITITNNSGSTIKNATIVIGLHNTVGVNPDNNNLPFQIYDEMFSEPVGVKFFDGNIELPYFIESESDCNYIVDKNVKTDQKTMAVFGDGKIAVYNATVGRMQISENDGLTWTNICDNITSLPYRVLSPDSQNNLFVASNDGYKLYKYTSVDGYMSGTLVIDMETDNTKIGSTLGEDGNGNLYLGTYQDSPWHCVIRKSTDHGNTWTVVFDTTECQHVHNLFVNKKATPNEIFIGLDGGASDSRAYVSTDEGATWTLLDVPYSNPDYTFRYAGENFYIGTGERLFFGGATLYKTSDYNDVNAYYPLFDTGQGVRDITNVIENSDDVLIAGGCVGQPVNVEQLFLSEDRGETWKTVLIRPYHKKQWIAGKGLRTLSKKGNQILSETCTGYAMRFVYGNGAKTILTVVNVGDIPISGKTITLKTGYVANVEQMDKVMTSYEKIDGKVADIRICDGYVIDMVSNKRVLTSDTERCDHNIKLGQTSEYKILEDHAYRLNGSVNLGKLSRLNFTKDFTISLLYRKSYETLDEYFSDNKKHSIFHVGDTKLILQQRTLKLIHGETDIYTTNLRLDDAYLMSVNDDYVRVTFYVTGDALPLANIYTDNKWTETDIECTEYPIVQNFSDNDFFVGNSLGSAYADIPNIARIEIYNRVLSYGEITALTNGCTLITNGSHFN